MQPLDIPTSPRPKGQHGPLARSNLSDEIRQDVENQVKKAALAIKTGKGSTYYGIGCVLAHITAVILHDQRSLMTVCAPIQKILDGGSGVIETFRPSLTDTETASPRHSATVLRRAIAELEK